MKFGRSAAFAAAMGVASLTSGVASATTPPSEPTTSTVAATTTTVAPGVVSEPTPPRGGSAAGGLVHDTGEADWDLRRIATFSLLGLLALAVAGHLYGRMQSTTPSVGRSMADPAPPR